MTFPNGFQFTVSGIGFLVPAGAGVQCIGPLFAGPIQLQTLSTEHSELILQPPSGTQEERVRLQCHPGAHVWVK